GFGPVVWSRTIGETRYALSLLPLGGYVRMLGHEDLPGREPGEELHPNSYAAKHPGWKAAILFGGVLFNLVSSWLILVALAFYGMPHFPAVVGQVHGSITTIEDGERLAVPSPASELGIERGDRVVEVNGERIRDFEDMIFATLSTGTNPIRLVVERDGERIRLPQDEDREVRPVYSADEGKVALGIGFPRSLVIAGSHRFGDDPELESGWRLERINDEVVGDITGQEAEQRLLPYAGDSVTLGLQRGRDQRDVRIRFAGTNVDLAGLFGLPLEVPSVLEGSPADRAGLRPGDVIVAVDGQTLSGSHDLRARVLTADEGGLELTLMRPGSEGWQEITITLHPEWDSVNRQHLIGIHMNALGSGRLPQTLPHALGQDYSPLAEAGVEAGSVLLDSRIGSNQRQLDVRTLPPHTTTTLVPLSDEAWVAMDRFRTVAMVSKLFGFRDSQAISQQLIGSQILHSGPGNSGHPHVGWLSVESLDINGSPRELALDLTRLPAADRQRVLSLPPGSYVVSTSRHDESGQRSLEIAIPEEDAQPQFHQVRAANIGSIVIFGIDERPYELEHFGEAFTLANHKSMQMIGRTLTLIPRFFQPGSEGGISAEKSLHGPIGIFSELQARLQHLGFPSFLRLMALIGLNLFLINLIPIPITDGGQLMLLGVEVAIRRPIPEIIVNTLNFIGFALIVMLMLFVIGNDIARQIFS
ncbi:MAG: PDZ domain-containing protein, partial [Planctomycetota bacterium]